MIAYPHWNLDRARENNLINSICNYRQVLRFLFYSVTFFELYTYFFNVFQIAMEVAACKPIANVIDTAVDIFLCSYIADSVVRNIFCYSELGQWEIL